MLSQLGMQHSLFYLALYRDNYLCNMDNRFASNYGVQSILQSI